MQAGGWDNCRCQGPSTTLIEGCTVLPRTCSAFEKGEEAHGILQDRYNAGLTSKRDRTARRGKGRRGLQEFTETVAPRSPSSRYSADLCEREALGPKCSSWQSQPKECGVFALQSRWAALGGLYNNRSPMQKKEKSPCFKTTP